MQPVCFPNMLSFGKRNTDVFACLQVSSPPMASGVLLRGRSWNTLVPCGRVPTASHAAKVQTAAQSSMSLQQVTLPVECGILES